jgi:hypothetical protein
MGRRGRRREDGALAAGRLEAPTQTYRDDDGNELELRGVLTLGARAQYAGVLSGGRHQEDAWQRATEWLFERLAVTWTIHGLQIARQKELVGRYRMASVAERQFVRESIRAHLEQHFPDMQAP